MTPSPRAAAARALQARVGGPDAAENTRRIHHAPGPRRFDPGSPIGRVHGDASVFIGGLRALLLQSLHPQVVSAVADHSDYRSDPWRRLQNTATFITTTTFGTDSDAARAVAIVRAMHTRVVGATPAGLPYAASDPHLIAWVHLAGAQSFLLAHQYFGRNPLSPAECDEYVAQAAVVARELGAQEVPTRVTELNEQLAGFRAELAGSEAARDVAQFLLRTPPIPLLARPAYALITSAGLALLPPWARRELAVPAAPALDPVLRAGGRAMTASIRWALDPLDPLRRPEGEPPAPRVRGRRSGVSS